MAKDDRGMDGGMGMSPRKAISSSMIKGGDNFGVKAIHSGGSENTDRTMGTGMKREMGDGERGIGDSVMHTKGKMPAQASPDHGPHNTSGADWSRDGKV